MIIRVGSSVVGGMANADTSDETHTRAQFRCGSRFSSREAGNASDQCSVGSCALTLKRQDPREHVVVEQVCMETSAVARR